MAERIGVFVCECGPNIKDSMDLGPIEYLMEGINQIQINPAKDVTFASVLRSILRQDPDVILVGEIRDKESELKGLDVGADDYVTKSSDTDKLLARIKMLLRRKRLKND